MFGFQYALTVALIMVFIALCFAILYSVVSDWYDRHFGDDSAELQDLPVLPPTVPMGQVIEFPRGKRIMLTEDEQDRDALAESLGVIR
jgi:ABC-type dipeptide/oligopeptide/nickel transport system permease subunit